MLETAAKTSTSAVEKAAEALSTGDSVDMPMVGHIEEAEDGMLGRARQTQTVITGLVVVIVASLAVIVVDQFDQSLGDPSSSSLSTAQNDVLSGFADMTSLVGPLLLVLIASVIIGVVQRVR